MKEVEERERRRRAKFIRWVAHLSPRNCLSVKEQDEWMETAARNDLSFQGTPQQRVLRVSNTVPAGLTLARRRLCKLLGLTYESLYDLDGNMRKQ